MKKIKKSEFTSARETTQVAPGEMLASLRKLQGLTQIELAKSTGITQSNISAMEKGRQQIGRDRVLLLAEALQVHPAVIMFPNYGVKNAA